MTTRSIVTSVPDVACDVCGRRLLRGERPDVFLATAGERRTVCELCGPRAAAEGWLRESDGQTLDMRPSRTRRARSLLGRLRQRREPGDVVAHSRARSSLAPQRSEDELDNELYELLDRSTRAASDATAGELDAPSELAEVAREDELEVARALELFNAGEQPRRVAGVSRSLGAPTVTVRPLSDGDGRVVIVVAWELCWYRYEVDLSDALAGPQLLERGMELDELPAEDRLANAAADEHGELVLLG